VLLMLAGAALAGGPPAASFSVPAAPSVAGHSFGQIGSSDGRYAYEVCGNTLRRLDRGQVVQHSQVLNYSVTGSAAPGMPVWKHVGVYTIEFAVSAVGALIAEAGGLAAIEGAYQAGWNGPGSVPGATAYCLTSALLTATGTHYMGKLVGRGNSFNRALAGGAVGGLLGGAAFVDYFVTRRNPHTAMMNVALVLPPLCAVAAYNLWRNDGAK
jgi:hypothetical protein